MCIGPAHAASVSEVQGVASQTDLRIAVVGTLTTEDLPADWHQAQLSELLPLKNLSPTVDINFSKYGTLALPQRDEDQAGS